MNATRRKITVQHLAAVFLAVIFSLSIAADLVSTYVTHFDYNEIRSWLAYLPPGAYSVALKYPSFVKDKSAFSLLDLNQNNYIDCKQKANGKLSCPELATLKQIVNQIEKWYWQHKNPKLVKVDSLIRFAASASLCKAKPRICQQNYWDANHDTYVSYIEFANATAKLTFTPQFVRQFDANKDNKLDIEEYPGYPQPFIHLLGTDSLGRDLLTRLIFGLRVSIAVALFATLVAIFWGGLLGTLFGLKGTKSKQYFISLLDVLQSLPFTLVVILLAVVSRSFASKVPVIEKRALLQAAILFCALGSVQWFNLARIVVSAASTFRSSELYSTLVALGYPFRRILFFHFVPQVARSIVTYSLLLMPTLMLEEAFLSFLGFGIQPPYPSFGTILVDELGYAQFGGFRPFVPALLLVAVTFSFNVLGGKWTTKK